MLDVADADAAVCWGPGLRWGIMGPNLLFHLGGGQGGIQHFMGHLSGPVSTWWKDLGTITEFSPQLRQTIIDGVLKEAGSHSIEELEEERNTMLLELLAVRADGEKAAQEAEENGNGTLARSRLVNARLPNIAKPKFTKASFNSTSGRLFFLDLGGGRVLSSEPDGTDLKTLVSEGRRLPDGLVVDAGAGHIYWTNMGNPKANPLSALISTAVIALPSFPWAVHSHPSSFRSTSSMARFTGRIAKACELCGRISMDQISRRLWKLDRGKLTGWTPEIGVWV